MLLSRKFYLFFLVFLIVIGFILRTYSIRSLPPLDVDEYSVGYNAYSIATTGKDEWGIRMPLFFRAYGDYKLPLDIYSSAFFFKLLGVNTLSLRLPAIIFGTLYIPLIFFLILILLGSLPFALLGAFLMTFSPYGIYFSRISSASISQGFLTLGSIVLFMYFLKTNKKISLFVSVLLLGLSLYAYPSSWIISPLLAFGYAVTLVMQKKKLSLFLVAIFFVFFIPIIWQFFLGGSSIRLQQSNFNSGVVLEINEFRHHVRNDLVGKFFHNKATYSLYTVLFNYSKHFNLSYLMVKDSVISQQRSPYPPLYAILLPFYLLGLVFIAKKYKNQLFLIILIWIAVSPFPSALTDGAVNPKRYLTFLGSDVVAICVGLFLTKISRKKIFFLIPLFLLLQIIHFLYFFFVIYPPLAHTLYLKGNIISNFVKKNYDTTDLFLYSTESLGEPQIYPLYGLPYSPKKYVREKKYEFVNSWYYIVPFDKFYYSSNLADISDMVEKNAKTKKMKGIFSGDELASFSNKLCYTILEKDIPISPGKKYFEVEFILCT